MAIKSGFFNSISGDRKYDAEDVNSFFDGVLTEGVFKQTGDALAVAPNSGMQIVIGSGKAWFLKTWLINTADKFLTLSNSDVTFDRIDVVALDFDKTDGVRANDIVILEGTPAASPVPVTLLDLVDHKQIPLAHILVEANDTVIEVGDITDKIGTAECPWLQGIVDLVLEYDDVTIGLLANELYVKDDAITNAKMADLSVNTAELINDAVDTSKLAPLAVGETEIKDNAITNSKLADDVVTDAELGVRALKVPKRTGNDAGDWWWDTKTDQVHAIGNVKMQVGCVSDDPLLSVNGNGAGQSTYNFPEAFADIPLVFVDYTSLNPNGGTLIPTIEAVSTTGFTVKFTEVWGQPNVVYRVNWLAIGQG